MTEKLKLGNLRNPEHLQFLTDSCKLFLKHNLEADSLSSFYEELERNIKQEEAAMAAEKTNEKIKEKNRCDAYRDKLHSKFFNHLKSILYDEEDPRFDAAQRVMKVVKEVGNPTRLAENAESGMITTLGNKLEPYRADLEITGAQEHLDKLLDTNHKFMQLAAECVELASARSLSDTPSVATARKQSDATYRSIVNAFDTFIDIKRNADLYKELVTELNTLIRKYDLLLTQRKGQKKDKSE